MAIVMAIITAVAIREIAEVTRATRGSIQLVVNILLPSGLFSLPGLVSTCLLKETSCSWLSFLKIVAEGDCSC